jgi:hypothetical protein
MVTQVVVSQPRRPVTVGRTQVVFHVRHNVEQMPTQWYETADGRYQISTPELTALELILREQAVGGIARVRAVLESLSESCTASGLRKALDAANVTPTTQRLGFLLSSLRRSDLAETIKQWLVGRTFRVIDLESGMNTQTVMTDHVFKVRVPSSLESNT